MIHENKNFVISTRGCFFPIFAIQRHAYESDGWPIQCNRSIMGDWTVCWRDGSDIKYVRSFQSAQAAHEFYLSNTSAKKRLAGDLQMSVLKINLLAPKFLVDFWVRRAQYRPVGYGVRYTGR